MEAVVGIRVEVQKYRDILEKIKKVKGVAKAIAVFGRYDIIASVEGKNSDEIAKAVTQGICAIGGVRATETWLEARL